MPEPVCSRREVEDIGWCLQCWPLIEYFVRNTVLKEVKCEVNPLALASYRQKW